MKTEVKTISTGKSVSLDSKFWRHFAKKIWEKQSLHLKNVNSNLMQISEAEIFDLLVTYSNRCRKLQDPDGFKFYIDGFKASSEDVLQVLPKKSDQSLMGYHQRMLKDFSDYCLVCDELLQVNLDKQHLLAQFTNQLYSAVGFPNRFSEMGLYLGNYKKTPFGVHVDSCGVFSFPVSGTKTFRLWPYEFGKRHPSLDRAFRYDKLKKDSIIIKAKKGDLVYWPSSVWHIAESRGEFSATWSLGVWVDRPLHEMAMGSIKDLLLKKIGKTAEKSTVGITNFSSKNGEVCELPEDLQSIVRTLMACTKEELEMSFLGTWVKHLSQGGFKSLPRTACKVAFDSNIQLQSEESKILWKTKDGLARSVDYCFAGVCLSSRSDKLLNLIQALNSGNTCKIEKFLTGRHRQADFEIILQFANVGAFKLPK